MVLNPLRTNGPEQSQTLPTSPPNYPGFKIKFHLYPNPVCPSALGASKEGVVSSNGLWCPLSPLGQVRGRARLGTG